MFENDFVMLVGNIVGMTYAIFKIETKKQTKQFTVASKKFWSSMSFPNLVRLSQMKTFSLPDYAHINKVSKLN
jgi:hypothetical protein